MGQSYLFSLGILVNNGGLFFKGQMGFNILEWISIKSEAQGSTEICCIFMCSPHFHAQINLIVCMFLLGASCFCFKRRESFILFYLKAAFLRGWLCSSWLLWGIMETVGKVRNEIVFMLWDSSKAQRCNRDLIPQIHSALIARLSSGCRKSHQVSLQPF